MIEPSPPAGPSKRPSVRREVLIFLACLMVAVSVFALIGGVYRLVLVRETVAELAPAELSARVERLAAVLPTLQRLEVTYYERSQPCRAFSYRRGTFTDPRHDDCGQIETDMPFDDSATVDVGQLEAALAAAGVNADNVVGSPSLGEFEFDTHEPIWCVLCPNVKYFHASSTRLPADDDENHYVAVDADWYVDIYRLGLQIGP